jgi:hypothetical protein
MWFEMHPTKLASGRALTVAGFAVAVEIYAVFSPSIFGEANIERGGMQTNGNSPSRYPFPILYLVALLPYLCCVLTIVVFMCVARMDRYTITYGIKSLHYNDIS